MTGSDGKLSSEWTAWNNKYQAQYGHSGYAPVPVLLSYDGKTIIACPPAWTPVTKEELMTQYPPSTGVDSSSYTVYNPTFSCETVRPYAFGKCETIADANVTITSTSATSAYLFYKCPELSYVELNIPQSNIVAYSFTDCAKLSSVKFNNTKTTKVLANSFSGCTSLANLWFAAGRGNGSAEDGAYPSTCTVTFDGQVN